MTFQSYHLGTNKKPYLYILIQYKSNMYRIIKFKIDADVPSKQMKLHKKMDKKNKEGKKKNSVLVLH